MSARFHAIHAIEKFCQNSSMSSNNWVNLITNQRPDPCCPTFEEMLVNLDTLLSPFLSVLFAENPRIIIFLDALRDLRTGETIGFSITGAKDWQANGILANLAAFVVVPPLFTLIAGSRSIFGVSA